MVKDLNDTYKMMMTMTMIMIKTQNCHNLANFAAITCRFCMVVDINDTYGLYFHAKFYVYFANKLMRTHLAYLSYISAFQAGFCGLAGILYISLSTFRSIYEETVIFHKFQCLERPTAPQKTSSSQTARCKIT